MSSALTYLHKNKMTTHSARYLVKAVPVGLAAKGSKFNPVERLEVDCHWVTASVSR